VPREQPTRLSVAPPERHGAEPDRSVAPPALTPAELHAMRRSAPLTPGQVRGAAAECRAARESHLSTSATGVR